jgi:2-octaprenyl-6-methoxyphenol hydroxylase
MMSVEQVPPFAHESAQAQSGLIRDREFQAIATDRIQPYDLAIVGGGIIGTLFACLLRSSGLRLVLIEADPQSMAVQRGQAYSINQLSSRILASLGLWQRLRPQVETYQQVCLSDAGCGGVVHFVPADIGTQTLGYVAEHRVLLQELQWLLRRCANVEWRCPAQLRRIQYASDRALLQVESKGQLQTLSARLVVGADGSRSFLRQEAGIATFGWCYWQSCIVAFVRPEKPHAQIAYERFQSDGPFAILPLPDNLCRIVWTVPTTQVDSLLQLDSASFVHQLQQRYGDHMGQLELVGSPSVFPVRLLHSRRYVQPGLALVGDAAHCCHPVGGQGINLGIRDAAALAEVITQAQAQGEDWASLSVLKRYERWRMPENLWMLAFTDLLTRTFSNAIAPVVALRRLGLWALATMPAVKALALRQMLGLSGRMPRIASQDGMDPPDRDSGDRTTSSEISLT